MTSASDKEAVVSNSMNPFAESAADVKKKEEKGAKEKEAANQPKWKVGWKRVSTRQWIRDFRDHVVKFQTFPYKTIVSMRYKINPSSVNRVMTPSLLNTSCKPASPSPD